MKRLCRLTDELQVENSTEARIKAHLWRRAKPYLLLFVFFITCITNFLAYHLCTLTLSLSLCFSIAKANTVLTLILNFTILIVASPLAKNHYNQWKVKTINICFTIIIFLVYKTENLSLTSRMLGLINQNTCICTTELNSFLRTWYSS